MHSFKRRPQGRVGLLLRVDTCDTYGLFADYSGHLEFVP